MKARTTSTILAVAGAVASTAFAAVPVIDTSSVSVRQDGSHTVVIDYTMNPATSGDKELAIVTVDVLTNGVSVGGEHLRTLSGDVNKVVAHTGDYKHKILWSPHKEGMPEFLLPAAQVTAQVTVWSTNSPPDYWVIDLTQPTDRTADRYYPNAGQLPGSVTNILYKTDRLVMRRIPAKGVTWKMGIGGGYQPYHYVTFSYDYWMAVFETTQAQVTKLQWNAATKYADSGASSGLTQGDAIPFCIFAYGSNRYGPCLRRTMKDDGSTWLTNLWPEYGHATLNDNCLLYNIRQGLGGMLIDLPTESEWEFACRAGSGAKYCNGDDEADLAKVGWYDGNARERQEVGLKDPNDWGLYDMHGNVGEWTLDWLSYWSSTPLWDPTGPKREDVNNDNAASGAYRYVHRAKGGYYGVDANNCRSGAVTSHSGNDVNGTGQKFGFRLCLVMP